MSKHRERARELFKKWDTLKGDLDGLSNDSIVIKMKIAYEKALSEQRGEIIDAVIGKLKEQLICVLCKDICTDMHKKANCYMYQYYNSLLQEIEGLREVK
jgi:hypothetical protein